VRRAVANQAAATFKRFDRRLGAPAIWLDAIGFLASLQVYEA
jgi:hypothetical protein